MKKTLVTVSIVLTVVGIVAFLYAKHDLKENQTLESLCQSFQIGQEFNTDIERQRIEKFGFHLSSKKHEDAGSSIIITTSGFEPDICELQIRDGLILTVK